jgi:hypothetical protein
MTSNSRLTQEFFKKQNEYWKARLVERLAFLDLVINEPDHSDELKCLCRYCLTPVRRYGSVVYVDDPRAAVVE